MRRLISNEMIEEWVGIGNLPAGHSNRCLKKAAVFLGNTGCAGNRLAGYDDL